MRLPHRLQGQKSKSRGGAYCGGHLAEQLVNLTLTYGRPPSLWKRAIITPVPKIPHPTELSDVRPISVTPLLSRIVERIVVK